MDDQIIMNTALTLTKSMCGILMHGSIESQDPKIKKTFSDTFTKYIEIQDELYTEMQNQGFYTIETVTESKIGKVKNKHPEDKI